MARSVLGGISICVAGLLLGVPGAQAASLNLRGDFETALAEFDEAQQIQSTDGPRARRLFRSAAARWDNVLDSGVINGQLEFNTGNAYLQADELGLAMLHYLRAQRLIPRDPLLEDNLATARKRCLINIPATRRSALLRGFFFWHYQTSFRERATWALTGYVLFWAVLALYGFAPRRSLLTVFGALGVITLALSCSLAVEQWHDRYTPAGVVTGMDVVVFKGPGSGYQRLFEQPLQPGVEFTLREKRAGWWNIELSDGRNGWIDQSTAQTIPIPTRE